MNSIFRFFLFLSLQIFWGCDFISAPYPSDYTSDKLVLTSTLDINDKNIKISLDTLVVYSFDNEIERYCPDCYINSYLQESYDDGKLTVELYENGVFLGLLQPDTILDTRAYYDSLLAQYDDDEDAYYLSIHNGFNPWGIFNIDIESGIHIGNEYEIVVNLEGYSTTKAKATALPKAEIIEFALTGDSVLIPDVGLTPEFDIEISDPDPTKRNFFALRATRYDEVASIGSEGTVEYLNHDYHGRLPLGEEVGKILQKNSYWYDRDIPVLISDDDFSNGVYSLRIPIVFGLNADPSEDDEVLQQTLSLEVSHVTELYYNYIKALRSQYATGFDAYATPVQIPSNIENGQGFFTITSTSEKSIRVNY